LIAPVVKWPRNYQDFYRSVRKHHKLILSGVVVAIDPSSGGSSAPGFAIFKEGKLSACGELDIPSSRPIQERLRILYDQAGALTPTPPDVLVIEEIKGAMAHEFLKWSVGVTLAAVRAPLYLGVPINCWKAVAQVTPGYVKGNDTDATIIGDTVIILAENERTRGK